MTDLARRLGFETPICETVRAVLHDGATLEDAFSALWFRPIRSEGQGVDLVFDNPAVAERFKRRSE